MTGLTTRSASVTLKERRRRVLVAIEPPLSSMHVKGQRSESRGDASRYGFLQIAATYCPTLRLSFRNPKDRGRQPCPLSALDELGRQSRHFSSCVTILLLRSAVEGDLSHPVPTAW